ncbi:hypothetical protein R3W88_029034 [Solanum pinnatisectum]|uniref:Uncharacterized protein n=1 Tax=Solanum pinnatisectum TaxID=50273 RepID=A0AAV9K632_9SOLN|nr:hypothetical protein R3W88_029034 [Solanum pinnatisectum]
MDRVRGNLKCMEREREGVGENNGGEGQRNGEDPNLQVPLSTMSISLPSIHKEKRIFKSKSTVGYTVCFKQLQIKLRL